MKIEKILPFARTLLDLAVHPGDIVIDATIGNGYDTVFLANLVGANGKVYGFDIQELAIAATHDRLKQQNLLEQVCLVHNSHEVVKEVIPPTDYGKITGAIFNLGYLPGGDKSIVTTSKSTLSAVKQIFEIMAPEGIIVLVIYHGHDGGSEERDELLKYCQQLDQKQAHILQYQFINQVNYPPFLIAIEKI